MRIIDLQEIIIISYSFIKVKMKNANKSNHALESSQRRGYSNAHTLQIENKTEQKLIKPNLYIKNGSNETRSNQAKEEQKKT